MPCRKAYIGSRKVIKFKFGTGIANSSKHALKLDIKEDNNLWKKAIKAELDQINEYKTFIVLNDDEPTPEEY